MAFPTRRPSIFSGLQQAAQLGQLAAQKEARDAQSADRERFTEIIGRVTSPDRTADDIFEASIILPKNMREGMLAGFNALTEEDQRNQLGFATQMLAAINSGNTGTALDLLEERALGDGS